MRLRLVAAAVVFVLGGEVSAQRATVSVERIEAGDVDGTEVIDKPWKPDLDIDLGVVRVCLNSGIFIFTVQRYPVSPFAIGVIFHDDEAEALADEAEVLADEAGVLANVGLLSIAEQGERGWDSFKVHEPTCVKATVVGGRARIYRLRFGVAW